MDVRSQRARAKPICSGTAAPWRDVMRAGDHLAGLRHTGALCADGKVSYYFVCLCNFVTSKEEQARGTCFSLAVENRTGSPQQGGFRRGRPPV